MFTGLIQGQGTLEPIDATHLRILCPQVQAVLQDLALGDSVAVDGVCLSVEEILGYGFVVSVSPETLRRTTLGHRLTAPSHKVNLESSLRVGSKLGGHFVTGHIDGTGTFKEAVPTATSWEVSFTVNSPTVSRYLVNKGSIAVNGVSLTVADCDSTGSWFKVAVIPLTWADTNLQALQSGDWVNLEGDIIGKYVEKFLYTPGRFDQPEEITEAFLQEHGFI